MPDAGVPALFQEGRFRDDPDLAGSVDLCAVCGRKVGKGQHTFQVATEGGGFPTPHATYTEEDGTGSGYFPVGRECAKRFPPGFLYDPEKED